MPYTILQAQRPTHMVDILNGVIFSKPIQSRRIDGPKGHGTEEVIDGLNGKTLVFTTPVRTVLFATADPVPVSDMLAEIDTQVRLSDALFEAALVSSGVAPGTLNPPSKVLKFQTGDAGGLAIDFASSTAAALLGFPTSGSLSRAMVDSTKIAGGGDTISGGLYIILAP